MCVSWSVSHASGSRSGTQRSSGSAALPVTRAHFDGASLHRIACVTRVSVPQMSGPNMI